MAQWIDCMDLNVGAVGYLVSSDNSNTRSWNVLSLRERPLRTNGSLQPRLTGWCGETNNISRTAKGAWKVVRKNAAGDRAQIVEIKGAELAAFLYHDGHPDLMPEDVRGELVIVGLKGGDSSDARAAVCVDLDRGNVTGGEQWSALVRADCIDDLLEQTGAEIVRGPEAWDGSTFGDGNGGTVERVRGEVRGTGLYAAAL